MFPGANHGSLRLFVTHLEDEKYVPFGNHAVTTGPPVPAPTQNKNPKQKCRIGILIAVSLFFACVMRMATTTYKLRFAERGISPTAQVKGEGMRNVVLWQIHK